MSDETKNNEYFREKFKMGISMWANDRHLESVSEDDENQLLDDLMACFDEKDTQ